METLAGRPSAEIESLRYIYEIYNVIKKFMFSYISISSLISIEEKWALLKRALSALDAFGFFIKVLFIWPQKMNDDSMKK